MTDRELTGAEDEQVRRLLADARHDEPVPDDVAARLDAVLADLVRERDEPSEGPVDEPEDRAAGPVVDLRARRRRRVAAGLLAAAAITVVGASVPALLRGMDSGAGSGVESGVVSDQKQQPSDAAPQQDAEAAAPEAGSVLPSPPQVRRIAPGEFDVAARDLTLLSTRLESYRDQPRTGRSGWCRSRPAWGEGRMEPVLYAGERAVLVLRSPQGDRTRVDLYRCGEDGLVRSTVPAP